MLCLFGIQLQAQQLTYYDASCFPLLGKATQDTGQDMRDYRILSKTFLVPLYGI